MGPKIKKNVVQDSHSTASHDHETCKEPETLVCWKTNKLDLDPEK